MRRGSANASSSPADASNDAESARALLVNAGIDLSSGSYPAPSPTASILSNLSWLGYVIGNSFAMRGMGDEASSRYKAALDILSHVVPAEEGGKPGNEWYFERRGDILAALRDPDGALDSYRRALACPEASEAKKRAALLRTIAQLYMRREAWQSAEEALREAAGAAASVGDGESEALVQLGLADLYCNRLSRFRDAVACAEEAGKAATNPETRATALQLKGAALLQLGLYSQALACQELVLEQYSGEGGLNEQLALGMLASTLSMTGRHDESASMFQRSLSLVQNNPAQAVDVLCQAASERIILGEFEGALADLDRAAAIARGVPDHSRVTNCCVLKGSCYLYKLHSPVDALELFTEALNEYAAAGPNETRDPYQLVRAMMGSSSAYRALGDSNGAMDMLRNALDICRSSPDLLRTTQAEVYRAIADLSSKRHQREEAEQFERNAIEIYHKLGMLRQEASTHRDLAFVLLDLGDVPSALEEINAASQIYDEGGFTDELLTTASAKALVLYSSGRMGEARAALEEGLSAHGDAEADPTAVAYCYAGLAAVAKKVGDAEGKLANLLRAADRLDSVRARLTSGDLRLNFQGEETTIYGGIVEAYYERGELPRSFEYAEKSKSRVLMEDLRTANLGAPPVDPALARSEAELLDDLRGAMNAHRGTRAGEAEGQLIVLWKKMEEKGPPSPELSEYLAVRRGDALGASDISLLLESLGGKAGIVEYYVLNKRLLIYTLSQTRGLVVTSKDVELAELRSLAQRLLAALRDESNDEYVGLSEQLGAYILSPVEEEISKFSHMHFVPHSFLHQIPIHALPLKGKALIEEHTVSYSQSASILRYLVARENASSSSTGALVVGDTTSDLTFARVEAQKIAALLGTEPILAESATKERVMSSLAAGERKKISFSCHATFSGDDPLGSGIKLHGNEMLTARDWLTLNVNADLVSLSACESAVSEERPGDEMMGLVRSIIFAGARSVVGSLWPVDDLAAFVTMSRFYDNLIAKRLDKPKSLREAQLYVRDLKDPSKEIDEPWLTSPYLSSFGARGFTHAYFWAPFVLMGAWS